MENILHRIFNAKTLSVWEKCIHATDPVVDDDRNVVDVTKISAAAIRYGVSNRATTAISTATYWQLPKKLVYWMRSR